MTAPALPRRTHSATKAPLALLIGGILALCASAQAQDPFDDLPTSPGSARDNTRVQGTVFDTQGQPMSDVMIWVTNDRAPANRVRSKTRKTGNYLVRDVAALYTRDDIKGIIMRARFEKEGYETLETRVAVEKNSIEQLHVVMVEEGESFEVEGLCAALSGEVTNAKGKPARGATVHVEMPDGTAVADPIEVDKRGEWELLLWDVDVSTVRVRAELGDQQAEATVELELDDEPMVFQPQVVDLGLGD